MKSVRLGRTVYNLPFYDLIEGPCLEDKLRMRESIRRHQRVFVNILEDQDHNIIEGATRLVLAAEENIPPQNVPFTRLTVGPEDAKALCLELNLCRRHLDRLQIERGISEFIKIDPSQSDRAIASKTGTTGKTVGRIRRKMEAGEEVPHQEARKGKDGVAQSSAGAKKAEARKGTGKVQAAQNGQGPVVLKDALGVEIPRKLLDVFGDGHYTAAVVWAQALAEELGKPRHLYSLQKRFKHYLFFDLPRFEDQLDKARGHMQMVLECLQHGQAEVVCPKCEGGTKKEGECKACRNQGHMSLHRHAELKRQRVIK
jgi:hypothetical protein